MPIEHVEQIANSQVVWAIIAIGSIVYGTRYLINTSEQREKKLMEFHEQSKADSNNREERLMSHVEKTTVELRSIAGTVGEIQKEMVRMNNRMDEIEKGE